MYVLCIPGEKCYVCIMYSRWKSVMYVLCIPGEKCYVCIMYSRWKSVMYVLCIPCEKVYVCIMYSRWKSVMYVLCIPGEKVLCMYYVFQVKKCYVCIMYSRWKSVMYVLCIPGEKVLCMYYVFQVKKCYACIMYSRWKRTNSGNKQVIFLSYFLILRKKPWHLPLKSHRVGVIFWKFQDFDSIIAFPCRKLFTLDPFGPFGPCDVIGDVRLCKYSYS